MAPKLLLADDSVTIQRVIELTFADEHIQVIAVGDGAQAIARIESERPDVVLADVGMPEKDGYEVAAYVKSQPHLRHIPVVLLTGAFEPVDEARARAIGCDGVLGKPFEPQMVIGRVKDLLAGRRPPSLWAGAPGQPPKPAERPAAPADQAQVDYKTFSSATKALETTPTSSTDSLDEYFDRLDAAFASIGTGEPAAASAPTTAPTASVEPAPVVPPPVADQVELVKPGAAGNSFADVLDRWDPSLSDDESPAAAASRQSAVSPAPMAPTPARPTSLRPPAVSPLSDAFAALLAAEEAPPPPVPAAPTPRVTPAPARAPVSDAAVPGPAPAVDDALIETIVQRVIERLTTRAAQDTVLQVAERLVREEIERIKSQAR